MGSLQTQGNNYSTTFIEADRLHKAGDNGNRADLTLISGVTAVTAATTPQARTTGNTVVYLTGKCDVGTAALNMPLTTLPAGFEPHDIVHLGVSIEATGGAITRGSVKLSGTAMTFDGTPTDGDILHFDGAVYLTAV